MRDADPAPPPDGPPPSISVIVPVWNVAAHVGACLDSLRTQTFRDFEAIVVDDGSTDESLVRARAAVGDDPRFRFLTRPNGGLSAARNTGLAAARGTFVAFVDSDDTVEPDYLAALHAVLTETGAPWVACAVRFMDPGERTVVHPAIHGDQPMPDDGQPVRFDFWDWGAVIRHYPSAWNKLYRRDFIGDLRFEEGLYYEDHPFFWQLAARTDHLLWLPRPLYRQTQGRPGQITRDGGERVFELLAVLDRLAAIGRGTDRPEVDTALARIATRLSFERSIAILDPARRARFAEASAAWFAREGLAPDPYWDAGIARSWVVRLGGECPLSIILAADAAGPALADTLAALEDRPRDAEVLVVPCGDDAGPAADQAARGLPAARILPAETAREAGWAAGLAAATGRVVLFLRPGDRPADLDAQVETMLRFWAHVGIAGMHRDGAPVPPGWVGFDPPTVLGLAPNLALTMFHREFLLALDPEAGPETPGAGPGFGPPVLAGAGMVLVAAAAAGETGACLPLAAESILAPPPPETARQDRIAAALATALPPALAAEAPAGWAAAMAARLAPAKPHWQPPAVSRITRPSRPRDAEEKIMLGFQARLGATVIYDVSFETQDYANISFFDGGRETILFHLSLRQGAQLAVLNRREDGKWEAERHFPVTLQPAPAMHRVEIRFPATGGAAVLLDGTEICAADGSFERLDRIRSLDCQGGIRPDSFVLTGALNSGRAGRGDLRLAGPMRVEGWAWDPEGGARQAIEIEVDGVAEGPRVAVAERPDIARKVGAATPRIGLAALLPGRLWRGQEMPDALDDTSDTAAAAGGAGADPTLILQPRSNGIPCGAPLTLRRSQIIAQIEALAAGPEAARESETMLLAIEHARFAALLPALSVAAQAMLARAADTYGVTDFLFPADAEAEADPDAPAHPGAVAMPALPPPDREERLLARLQDRFATDLRQNPGTDPGVLLRKVLADPTPPAVRRRFYLGLAETFCQHGAFEALHAVAATDTAVKLDPPPEPDPDRWWSVLLPFLYLDGRFDALRSLFWAVARKRQGWIVTPAAAWVVRDLAAGQPRVPVPSAVREDLLYAFLALVETEAKDPTGRAPCAQLIDATVALLAGRGRLSVYLAADLERVVLVAYGLSRAFWTALDAAVAAGGEPLSPRLAAARAAFATVEAAPAHPAAAVPALRLLAQGGAVDAARVRLDLFGPAGLPAEGVPSPATLMAEGIDPAEAAVRAFAAPGAPPVPADWQPLLRKALRDRLPDLPVAPFAALQRTATERALALAAGTATPGTLTALLDDLGPLAGSRSGGIGFGLGLRLMDALLLRDDRAAAEQVLGRIAALWTALPAPEVKALERAPALVGALAALIRREAATGDALATSALALFPAALPEAEALAAAAPGVAPATDPRAALFDTIVVVLSCRPYLDSRVPVLRAGWLARLTALGIPYVIAVGGGDGRVEGDVVHLDAPDDYEGLPQKTLAAARWVLENTPWGHLYKIDDDCVVDPAGMFLPQDHAAHDFYGRRVSRGAGDTDRIWHLAKSRSERGRFELDRSPEPSVHCDGGSGYALSRRAMAALADAETASETQMLIAASFMEDKLVGDLLATRGILPAETDYVAVTYRRTHSGAIAVPRWANGFLPSAASPTRMAHLDDPALVPAATTALDDARLLPRKVWPGTRGARLGHNSNALDLLGDEAQLARLAAAPVAVVACMRNERAMLPLFLAHYRAMGVEAFLIADNLSDDGTREYLAAQADVALFSVDTDYNVSEYGVAWQQALLASFRPGRWTVVADADELLVADAGRATRLPDLLASPAFAGAEAARVFMLDLYPQGPLSSATFDSGDPFDEADHCDRDPFRITSLGQGPYSSGPTWTSALRHRLLPGSRPELFVAQKIAMLRYHPWMRLSAGLHYVADARLAGRDLVFGHFKYTAQFRAKAEAEVRRRQHFNDAEEYRKYLALLAEGRDRLYDPAVSVHWQDCAAVRSILEGRGAP